MAETETKTTATKGSRALLVAEVVTVTAAVGAGVFVVTIILDL